MAQSHAQCSDWDDPSSLRLYLTTMAGTVIQTQVPLSIHHTWEMLEEYLVEHLPLVSHIDTFGCELTLLDADTHLALQDPIQEDLWWNTQFCLIVHECFLIAERKEQIQGLEYEDCPKAIRVPANDSGILEAKASSRPRESDMSELTQGSTRSVDKPGGTVTHFASSSCRTQS